MADDATTLNYVDDATTVDETADATTVTVSDDSTVVESAAAGAPGVGVPSGGTTGQALVKNSNADYDTHWSTPSTVAALADLTDVDTTGVADGDALVYDDATDTWVPGQAGAVDSVNGETGTVVLDAADVPYTGSGYTAVGIPTEPDDVQEALDDLMAVLSPVALGFIGHVGATDPHGDRAYAAGLVDDLSGVTNAAQARTNLGLGSAATHASGDFDTAGAASAAQTAAQSYAAGLVDDLSGVTDAATARTNLGLGGAATKNVGTTAGTVAAGDDSRLSDARTPTAHASTHAPGGTDALPWTTIHGRGTAASRPAAAASNAGYIYLATDTGTLSRSNGATWDDLLAAGTGATNYTAGNDSRLSDARTPTTHATSHKSGGSDPIKLNELAAPTAAVALNSQKITGMANGAASGDGATYDQTPASILTAQGDLLYASAANTPARLAKGTAFQVLRTNAGATAPEWTSGGIHLIAETVLNASAASIDFQNIPATYRHLRIECMLRGDASATTDYVNVTWNNDTTNANYDSTLLYFTTSSGIVQSLAVARSRSVANAAAATAPASTFTLNVIDVPYYASTSFYKMASAQCFESRARSAANTVAEFMFNLWASTAAISRVTLTPAASSNFVSGTSVALYGIG